MKRKTVQVPSYTGKCKICLDVQSARKIANGIRYDAGEYRLHLESSALSPEEEQRCDTQYWNRVDTYNSWDGFVARMEKRMAKVHNQVECDRLSRRGGPLFLPKRTPEQSLKWALQLYRDIHAVEQSFIQFETSPSRRVDEDEAKKISAWVLMINIVSEETKSFDGNVLNGVYKPNLKVDRAPHILAVCRHRLLSIICKLRDDIKETLIAC
jgi:hypothetical protein